MSQYAVTRTCSWLTISRQLIHDTRLEHNVITCTFNCMLRHIFTYMYWASTSNSACSRAIRIYEKLNLDLEGEMTCSRYNSDATMDYRLCPMECGWCKKRKLTLAMTSQILDWLKQHQQDLHVTLQNERCTVHTCTCTETSDIHEARHWRAPRLWNLQQWSALATWSMGHGTDYSSLYDVNCEEYIFLPKIALEIERWYPPWQ